VPTAGYWVLAVFCKRCPPPDGRAIAIAPRAHFQAAAAQLTCSWSMFCSLAVQCLALGVPCCAAFNLGIQGWSSQTVHEPLQMDWCPCSCFTSQEKVD